jgi:ribosome biogenesis protein Nip4
MSVVTDFAAKFGENVALKLDLIVKKDGRYFLLNRILSGLIQKDFYYAGTYLGKTKDGKFFPSFNLLSLMASSKSNKVVVDQKASWLFICGRDIFRKGIITVDGSRGKNALTLVMNQYGECLGFGKITCRLDIVGKGAEVAVRNISDVGDFLRREI